MTSYRIIRWAFLAVVCAVCLVIGLTEPGHAATRSDQPPQCFTVRIAEPGAPHALWVRFCGTGPAGVSPLEEGVAGNGPLVVDGGDLVPADCTRVAPCVVLWPKSPVLP